MIRINQEFENPMIQIILIIENNNNKMKKLGK